MSDLNPRRFEHQVSEPKELWDGDLVEMATLKRNKDLFRLVNSATHTSACASMESAND